MAEGGEEGEIGGAVRMIDSRDMIQHGDAGSDRGKSNGHQNSIAGIQIGDEPFGRGSEEGGGRGEANFFGGRRQILFFRSSRGWFWKKILAMI